MAVKQVPGGGKNNRQAARLLASEEATTWSLCSFEDLRVGDVAVVFEEDNTPVAYSDGCITAVVMSPPQKNSEGVWGFRSCTCMELANIKLPARSDG